MTRNLIVAPQWIGDAVMSEPLLARLAARGEALVVGALPGIAPVYRAKPAVGEVLEWPFAHGRLDWAERRRVADGLRDRFDAAYVLPNSLKSALVPFLARVPRRIGYRGEGRWGLLNERLPNPPARPPMVAFYAALADVAADPVAAPGPSDTDIGPASRPPPGARRAAPRPTANPADGAPRSLSDAATAPTPWPASAAPTAAPRLQLDAAHLDTAAAAAGVARGGYWAFAPGAEYGPAKRWPASHYAELARVLWRVHRLPVLLLGSPAERALCDRIAAAADSGACRVLAGRVPLLDAMALIAGARGVVSNDSGLMHVAAAFGVPQVAIFGSTSPDHTPPSSPRARVLWLKEELQLDCAPCFDRVCRYGHTRCLAGVAPERVRAALEEG